MDQNEMVFGFIISQGILSRNFQKLAYESHLESTSHFRDQWTDLRRDKGESLKRGLWSYSCLKRQTN